MKLLLKILVCLVCALALAALLHVSGTLKELKALGRLRNVDVTLAALGMQGMIMWLSYWYKPNGPVSKEQAAAQYCEILLNGLLLPKPETKPAKRTQKAK